MIYFPYVIPVLLYILVAVVLMNKFRRKELIQNPPWISKEGIERECVVFWEVVITPFVLLSRLATSTGKRFITKKNSIN